MKPIPIAQYLNQFGRVEAGQGERAQKESVLLRPRPLPAPPIDIETRLTEALEKGRQEGLAAGRAEMAAALAFERSHAAEKEAAERLAWQAGEYGRFADKIEVAFGELEDRIARSVARILKPFLNEERVKQVTHALCENLSRILSNESPSALKITGPEALLRVLREQISSQAVNVDYVAAEGVDVTIEAHQTIIRSQLQAWVDHLDTIGE
jgi:hypothetical protein